MGKFSPDLVGQKFGSWTVIKILESKGRHKFYKCRCDCGLLFDLRGSYLFNRKTLKCKFCKGKIQEGLSAFRRIYRQYRHQAIMRNFVWELTENEFRETTSSNCYYTGLPPSNICKTQGGQYVYNGIDRLDNNVGYTVNNCVPCNGRINQMKSDLSYSQFIELCHLITTHKKEVNINLLKAI